MEPGKTISASFTAIDANNQPINEPMGWTLKVIDRNTQLSVYESQDFKSEGNVHTVEFVLDEPVKGYVVIVDEEGNRLSRPGNLIVKVIEDTIDNTIPEGMGGNFTLNPKKVTPASGTRLNDPAKQYNPAFLEGVLGLEFHPDLEMDGPRPEPTFLKFGQDQLFPVGVNYAYNDGPVSFSKCFIGYDGAPDFLMSVDKVVPNNKFDLTLGSIFFDEKGDAYWYNFEDLAEGKDLGNLVLHDAFGLQWVNRGELIVDTDRPVVLIDKHGSLYFIKEDSVIDSNGSPLGAIPEAVVISGILPEWQHLAVENHNRLFINTRNEIRTIPEGLEPGMPEYEEIVLSGPWRDLKEGMFIDLGPDTDRAFLARDNTFFAFSVYGERGPEPKDRQAPKDGLAQYESYRFGNIYVPEPEGILGQPDRWKQVDGYASTGHMFIEADGEGSEPEIVEPFAAKWKVPAMLATNTSIGYAGNSQLNFSLINDEFGFVIDSPAAEWSENNYLRKYDTEGFFGNGLLSNGAPTGVDLENYLTHNGVKLFEKGAITLETVNDGRNVMPSYLTILLPGTDTFVPYDEATHGTSPLVQEQGYLLFGNLKVPAEVIEQHIFFKQDGTQIKFGQPGYIAPRLITGRLEAFTEEDVANNLPLYVDKRLSVSSKGKLFSTTETFWKADGTMFVDDSFYSFGEGDNRQWDMKSDTFWEQGKREIISPEDENYIPFELQSHVIATMDDGTYLLSYLEIPAFRISDEKYKLFGEPSTELVRRFAIADGRPYGFDKDGNALLAPRPAPVAVWDKQGFYYPMGADEAGIPPFDRGWAFNPEWTDDVFAMPSRSGSPFPEFATLEQYLANNFSPAFSLYEREEGFIEQGKPNSLLSRADVLTSNIVAWDTEGTPIRYDALTIKDRKIWAIGNGELVFKPAGADHFLGEDQEGYEAVPEGERFIVRNGVLVGSMEGSLRDYYVGADRNAVLFGENGYHNDGGYYTFDPTIDILPPVDLDGTFNPGDNQVDNSKRNYMLSKNHLGQEYAPDSTWSKDGETFYYYVGKEISQVNFDMEDYLPFKRGEEGFVEFPQNREAIAYTDKGLTVLDIKDVPAVEVSRYNYASYGEPLSHMPSHWDPKTWVFGFDENGKPLKDRDGKFGGIWDDKSVFYPSGVVGEGEGFAPGQLGWKHPLAGGSVVAVDPQLKVYYSTDDLPDFEGKKYGEAGWKLPDDWMTLDSFARAFMKDGTPVKFGFTFSNLYSYTNTTVDGYTLEKDVIFGMVSWKLVTGGDDSFEVKNYYSKDAFGIYTRTEEGIPSYFDPVSEKLIPQRAPNWRITNSFELMNGATGRDEEGNYFSDQPYDLTKTDVKVWKEGIIETSEAFAISIRTQREKASFSENSWNLGKLMCVTDVDGVRTLVEPSGFLVRNKDPEIRGTLTRYNSSGTKSPFEGRRNDAMFHYQSRNPVTETLTYVTEDGTDLKIDVTVTFEGAVITDEIKFTKPSFSTPQMNDFTIPVTSQDELNQIKLYIEMMDENKTPIETQGWMNFGFERIATDKLKGVLGFDGSKAVFKEKEYVDTYAGVINPALDISVISRFTYLCSKPWVGKGWYHGDVALANALVLGQNNDTYPVRLYQTDGYSNEVHYDLEKEREKMEVEFLNYFAEDKRVKLEMVNLSYPNYPGTYIGFRVTNTDELTDFTSCKVDIYFTHGMRYKDHNSNTQQHIEGVSMESVTIVKPKDAADPANFLGVWKPEDIKLGRLQNGVVVSNDTIIMDTEWGVSKVLVPYIQTPGSNVLHRLPEGAVVAVNASNGQYTNGTFSWDKNQGGFLVSGTQKLYADNALKIQFKTPLGDSEVFIVNYGTPEEAKVLPDLNSIEFLGTEVVNNSILNSNSVTQDLFFTVLSTGGEPYVNERIHLYDQETNKTYTGYAESKLFIDEATGKGAGKFKLEFNTDLTSGTIKLSTSDKKGEGKFFDITVIDKRLEERLAKGIYHSAEFLPMGEETAKGDGFEYHVIKAKVMTYDGSVEASKPLLNDNTVKLSTAVVPSTFAQAELISVPTTNEDPYYVWHLRSSTKDNVTLEITQDKIVHAKMKVNFEAAELNPKAVPDKDQSKVISTDFHKYAGGNDTIVYEPRDADGNLMKACARLRLQVWGTNASSSNTVSKDYEGVFDATTGQWTFVADFYPKGEQSYRVIGPDREFLTDKLTTQKLENGPLLSEGDWSINGGLKRATYRSNPYVVVDNVMGYNGKLHSPEQYKDVFASWIPETQKGFMSAGGTARMSGGKGHYSTNAYGRAAGNMVFNDVFKMYMVAFPVQPETILTSLNPRLGGKNGDEVAVTMKIASAVTGKPIDSSANMFLRKVGDVEGKWISVPMDIGKNGTVGTLLGTAKGLELGQYDVRYHGASADFGMRESTITIHDKPVANLETSFLTVPKELRVKTPARFAYLFTEIDPARTDFPAKEDVFMRATHKETKASIDFPATDVASNIYTFEATLEAEGMYEFQVMDTYNPFLSKPVEKEAVAGYVLDYDKTVLTMEDSFARAFWTETVKVSAMTEFFDVDGAPVPYINGITGKLTKEDGTVVVENVVPSKVDTAMIFEFDVAELGNYKFSASVAEMVDFVPATHDFVVAENAGIVDPVLSKVTVSDATPMIGEPMTLNAVFISVKGEIATEVTDVEFFRAVGEAEAVSIGKGVVGEDKSFSIEYTPVDKDVFTISARAANVEIEGSRSFELKSEEIKPTDVLPVDVKASDFVVLNNPAKVSEALLMTLKVVDVKGNPINAVEENATLNLRAVGGDVLFTIPVKLAKAEGEGEFTTTIPGHDSVARFDTEIVITSVNEKFEIMSKKVLVIGDLPKPDPFKSKLVIKSLQIAGAPIVAEFTAMDANGEPIGSMDGLALEVRDDDGNLLETVTEYQQLGKSCNFTFKTSFVGKGSIVVVNSKDKAEYSPVTETDITLVASHSTTVTGNLNVGQTVTVLFKPRTFLGKLIEDVKDVFMGIWNDGALSEASSAEFVSAGGFALEYKLTKEGPLTFGASSETMNFIEDIQEVMVAEALEVFSAEKSTLELSKNTVKPKEEFVIGLFAKGNRGGVFDKIDLDATVVVSNIETRDTPIETKVTLTRESSGIFTVPFVIDGEGDFDIKLKVTSEGMEGTVGKDNTITIAHDAVWAKDGTYYPRGLGNIGIPLFAPGWKLNPEYGHDDVIIKDKDGNLVIMNFHEAMKIQTQYPKQYHPEFGYLKMGDTFTNINLDILVTSTLVGIGKNRPEYYSSASFETRRIWSMTKNKEGKDVVGYKPTGSRTFVGKEDSTFVAPPKDHVATHNGIMYFGTKNDSHDSPSLMMDQDSVTRLYGTENWINLYDYKDQNGDVIPNVNHLGQEYSVHALWNDLGTIMYIPITLPVVMEDGDYDLDNFIAIPETSTDFIDRPKNRKVVAYTGKKITVWEDSFVPDSWSEPQGRMVKYGEPLSEMPEEWDNERFVYAFDGEGKPIKGFRNGPKGIWDNSSAYYPSGVMNEAERLVPGSIGWMHPLLSDKYNYITDNNKPTTAQDFMPDFNGIPYGESGWFVDPTWSSRPDVARTFGGSDKRPIGLEEEGSIGYLLVDSWTDKGYRVIATKEGGHPIIDIVGPGHRDFKPMPEELVPIAKDRFGIYIFEEKLVPHYLAPNSLGIVKYGSNGWFPSQRITMLNGVDGFDEGPIYSNKLDPNSVKYYTSATKVDTRTPIRIEVTITRENSEFLEPIWTKGWLKAGKMVDGKIEYEDLKGVVVTNRDQRVFTVEGREFNRQRAVFHYHSNFPGKEFITYVNEETGPSPHFLEVEFTGQNLNGVRDLKTPWTLGGDFFPAKPWIPVGTTENHTFIADAYADDKRLELMYLNGFYALINDKYVPLTRYENQGWAVDVSVTADKTPKANSNVYVSLALPSWDKFGGASPSFVPYDKAEVKVDHHLLNDTIVLGYNNNSAGAMVRYLSTNQVHLDQIVRRSFTLSLKGASYGGKGDVSFRSDDKIRLGEVHVLLGIDPLLNSDSGVPDTQLTSSLSSSYNDKFDLEPINVKSIKDKGEAITVSQEFALKDLNFDSNIRGEIVDERITYPKFVQGAEPLWFFVNPVTNEKVYLSKHTASMVSVNSNARLITTHLDTIERHYFNSQVPGVDNVFFKTVRGTSAVSRRVLSQASLVSMVPFLAYVEENPWIEEERTGNKRTNVTLLVQDKNKFPVTDGHGVMMTYVRGERFYPGQLNLTNTGTSNDKGFAVYRSAGAISFDRHYGKATYRVTSATGWDFEIELEYKDEVIESLTRRGWIERAEYTIDPEVVKANGKEVMTIRALLYKPNREIINPEDQFYLNRNDFDLRIHDGLIPGVKIERTHVPTSYEDRWYEWKVTSTEHGVRQFVAYNISSGFRSVNTVTGSFTVDKPFWISDKDTKWWFNYNPYIDRSKELVITGDVRSVMQPIIPLKHIDDFVITARDLMNQGAKVDFKFIGDPATADYRWIAKADHPSKFEITISSVKGEYRTKPGEIILEVYPDFKHNPFSAMNSVLDYPNRRVVSPSAKSTPVTQHYMDINGYPIYGVWDTELRIYSTKTSDDGRLLKEIYLDRERNNRWDIGLEPTWIQITSKMAGYDSGRILATTVKGEWAEPGNFDPKTVKVAYSKPNIQADGNDIMIVSVFLRDGYFPDEPLQKVVGSKLVTENGMPIPGFVELIHESMGLAQFAIRTNDIDKFKFKYKSDVQISKDSFDMEYVRPITYHTPTENVSEVDLSFRDSVVVDKSNNPVIITAYLNHASNTQFTSETEVMPCIGIGDIELIQVSKGDASIIEFKGEIANGIYRWEVQLPKAGDYAFRVKSDDVYYESKDIIVKGVMGSTLCSNKPHPTLFSVFSNTDIEVFNSSLQAVKPIAGEGELGYVHDGDIRGRIHESGDRPVFSVNIRLYDSNLDHVGLADNCNVWLGNKDRKPIVSTCSIAPTEERGLFVMTFHAPKHRFEEEIYICYKDGRTTKPFKINWSDCPNPFIPYKANSSINKLSQTFLQYTNDVLHTEHTYEVKTKNINNELIDHPEFIQLNGNELGLGLPGYARMKQMSKGVYQFTIGTVRGDNYKEVVVKGFANNALLTTPLIIEDKVEKPELTDQGKYIKSVKWSVDTVVPVKTTDLELEIIYATDGEMKARIPVLPHPFIVVKQDEGIDGGVNTELTLTYNVDKSDIDKGMIVYGRPGYVPYVAKKGRYVGLYETQQLVLPFEIEESQLKELFTVKYTNVYFDEPDENYMTRVLAYVSIANLNGMVDTGYIPTVDFRIRGLDTNIEGADFSKFDQLDFKPLSPYKDTNGTLYFALTDKFPVGTLSDVEAQIRYRDGILTDLRPPVTEKVSNELRPYGPYIRTKLYSQRFSAVDVQYGKYKVESSNVEFDVHTGYQYEDNVSNISYESLIENGAKTLFESLDPSVTIEVTSRAITPDAPTWVKGSGLAGETCSIKLIGKPSKSDKVVVIVKTSNAQGSMEGYAGAIVASYTDKEVFFIKPVYEPDDLMATLTDLSGDKVRNIKSSLSVGPKRIDIVSKSGDGSDYSFKDADVSLFKLNDYPFEKVVKDSDQKGTFWKGEASTPGFLKYDVRGTKPSQYTIPRYIIMRSDQHEIDNELGLFGSVTIDMTTNFSSMTEDSPVLIEVRAQSKSDPNVPYMGKLTLVMKDFNHTDSSVNGLEVQREYMTEDGVHVFNVKRITNPSTQLYLYGGNKPNVGTVTTRDQRAIVPVAGVDTELPFVLYVKGFVDDRFNQDTLKITTDKSRILNNGRDTATITVEAFKEHEPTVPLELTVPPKLVRKDGKPIVGKVEYLEEVKPGVFTFRVTSTTIGDDEFAFATTSMVSDKSVTITYYMDPSKLFRCPGKDKCTASKLIRKFGQPGTTAPLGEDEQGDIEDPSDDESNCNQARAVISWHRKNGTFDKKEPE